MGSGEAGRRSGAGSNLAICAIFKNEADYLYEWLSFHAFVGVQHFYLYNNNSTDSSLDVIASWPFRDRVTVIDWPDIPGQISAYRHMIATRRDAATWCAFIDCDEFLCPQSGASLGEALDRFAPRCSALYAHWLMFGSSGEIEHRPGLVTERFTRRAYDSFGPNQIGKSIIKLAEATEVGFCHMIRTRGTMLNDAGETIDQMGSGAHTGYSHRFLAVNHYFTKSRAEWRRRRAAGKADTPSDSPDFFRAEEEFHRHDQNVHLDLTAFRIAQCMKPIYYPDPLNISVVSPPATPLSLWT